MKRYVAAALTIGIAIGPASAQDTGSGGNVGGAGVGAGVSAGSQGASVGAGTSVGGAGVGAGVSAGSQGASVGAGTSVGGVSGANVGATVGAGAASLGAPGSPAVDTTANDPGKSDGKSIALPLVLRPSKAGLGDSTRGYPFGSLGPLGARPGTPTAVVQACRAAILSAATPLGALRVHAVSAGALRQRRGALTAPIAVRIDYARRGGIEVRQARVGCRLDAAGRVTAVR
ncbi:hypothetical protein [Mesorhizobium sp. M1393]|uniref:hypothetical protein n=1 Tax=Mesorhizobium sp. M1393 TaxID=2957094 RepID=UPI00333B7A75